MMSVSVLFVLSILIVSAYASTKRGYCSGKNDSEIISSMFRKCNPPNDKTYCPEERWLQLFKDADMKVGPKYGYKIVNIGFNKGYNFATWLNVFAPSTNIDVTHWFTALKKIKNLSDDDRCGSCRDCKSAPFKPTVPSVVGQVEPEMHFVGVDLNKENIVTVETVIAELRQLRNISSTALTLKLVHAAAGAPSDLVGSGATANKLRIPKCPSGNELCKIPDSPTLDPSVEYEYVDVIGVDNLIRDLHFLTAYMPKTKLNSGPKAARVDLDTGVALSAKKSTEHKGHHSNHNTAGMIDILHIDTEGNDAEVLKATTGLIKDRKVRALIFEYHQYLPWGNTALSGVVKELAQHHLECFFLGLNRMWPITGQCWHENFEFHSWSNVMCVLRSDIWYQAIQPIVVTLTSLRSPFKEGGIYKAPRFSEIFVLKGGKMRGFDSMNAFNAQNFTEPVQEIQYCNIHTLYPEGAKIV